MKLITEMSYDFEISEDSKTKDMFAVGIFSSAELLNNNKRMYKKDILEREVIKVQEKIEKKCLWGELGHPPNPEVNPDKIALRTTQLEWRGNDLYGKAKILDTPMGQIAKTLVKEGQMGISSRGLGTVGDDGYVNEDFHLITWDLVTDPSNNPSWVNGIFEGQSFALPGMANVAPTEDKIKEAQKAYFNYLMDTIDGLGEGMGQYSAQAQRHVEDSIESIKQFVKDGMLNKKHMSNLQNLLSDLAGIWRKSKIK